MQDHTPTPQFLELSAHANNITGQRFGRLVALGAVGHNESMRLKWLCQCDCGNAKIALAKLLLNGKIKSCGCLKHEPSPGARDITNQRFGRLVALERIGSNGRRAIWQCACDCGNKPLATSRALLNGEKKSCGCLLRESVKAAKTHGMTGGPLYGVWKNMTQRCTNPNHKDYAGYGGRGIGIFEDWRHDFKAFHDYVSSLAHCGEKGYTLDRIDNDLGYQPGNLKFSTQLEQSRNTRHNRMITYNDKTQCLQDWEAEVGITRWAIYGRLRRGWSVERALTEPVKPNRS